MKIRIPAEVIKANHTVSFSFGAENFAGQKWVGSIKGNEKLGEHIRVQRQIGADADEYSRVEVVGRDCPVTGDVIMELRAEGASKT